MRRSKVVLVGVVGALVVATALLAAPPPRGPLHFFLTPFEMSLYLDLTEDQVQATEELWNDLQEALTPFYEDQTALREELRALLDEEEPDLPAVGSVVVSLDENRQAIEAARAAYEVDFRALLTVDQLPKFDHMQEILHLLRHRNPPPDEGPAI
jgi:Spy/CpxP family protein refolding chaperone